MSHGLTFYKPIFVTRTKSNCGYPLRYVDLWSFKSTKSNKRYIIEVEAYENRFYGLKFYWKGVEKSKNRYSILTNDFEPRTIVRSCIEVMFEYYRKDSGASFGFVAAPDLEEDIVGKKIDPTNGSRRFQFYQRLMVNLFGPQVFLQESDETNTVYLLLNRDRLDKGEITIKDIEIALNRMFIGNFTF